MERDLMRKITIVNLLWESSQITSIELAEYLEVTAATIKSDIKFINTCYCSEDSLLIGSSLNGYYILNKNKRDKAYYMKKIYKESLFIRACCHFLKNNFSNVIQFANQEFISKSKAYYLKGEVMIYLKEIQVITATNEIDECRLRFLLSDYSKKYASILFQLHFNRRKKGEMNFEKNTLCMLKKTKVYERLSQPVRLFLEKELYGQVKDEEIFYFVLIFNVMNANYFEDGGISEIHQSYVNLISNSPILFYKELVYLFEKGFNIRLEKEKLFEAALITFLRKCIFNLQSLIPEEHFELGNLAEVPNHIFLKSREIFYQWNNLTKLNLSYSDYHIKYFTSKIYFLLSKRKRPQNIYLLTSFYTDYLLAKEILNREYGNIVHIEQYNPNKQISTYSVNDLVLYDTKYEVLSKLPCLTLKISYVFDLV